MNVEANPIGYGSKFATENTSNSSLELGNQYWLINENIQKSVAKHGCCLTIFFANIWNSWFYLFLMLEENNPIFTRNGGTEY